MDIGYREPLPATVDGLAAAAVVRDYEALKELLVRRLRNRPLAEEMLHQAVIEALDHLAARRIRDPSRLAGYVYRVSLNLVRNHSRKFANRDDLHLHGSALDLLADEQTNSDRCLDDAHARLVRAVLEELPVTRDRLILQRYYLDEEDKAVICHALEISQEHFNRVLHRARRRLRELLETKGLGWLRPSC